MTNAVSYFFWSKLINIQEKISEIFSSENKVTLCTGNRQYWCHFSSCWRENWQDSDYLGTDPNTRQSLLLFAKNRTWWDVKHDTVLKCQILSPCVVSKNLQNFYNNILTTYSMDASMTRTKAANTFACLLLIWCHFSSQILHFVLFFLNITFPILPFSHSSSQDSAWQDQFLVQRPRPAWSSTCTHGRFCDCTARRCWTSARCRPHTARGPGTDLQPQTWTKECGCFNGQAESLQNKRCLLNSQCTDGETVVDFPSALEMCIT